MGKIEEGDGELSAAEFNRHVDVADWFFRTKQFRDKADQNVSAKHPGVIWIKNSSSADRRQGEILKVGAYLATGLPFYQLGQYPWFDAAIHDGTDAPLAVLLRPLPDGEIGPAQISGVCPALVNKIHADNVYARPAASNDVLQGDVLGQVRILHQIGTAGTGEKECLVDLSGGRYQGWGKADAAISKGSTGTVSWWNGLGGSEADSGMNVTASAKGVAIVSGKIVQLALMNNVVYAGCWES